MSGTKHRFSAAERFGVWMAFDGQCQLCSEPFQFAHCTIDHVIAESTPADEVARLRTAYALGDTFEVNDFGNWIPVHAVCNSRKGPLLEREPSLVMVSLFRDISRRAETARLIAERTIQEKQRSKVLAQLAAAVEEELLCHADVEALLAGLPASDGARLLLDRRWHALRAGSSYQLASYQPTYPNAELRALGERLASARDRLGRLLAVDADASEVKREIIELRRTIREGGQVREGDVLGDRYVLLRALGRGGFATVWEAMDDRTRTRVAVKVLRSDLAIDPVRRERFARGARIMRQLASPSIVPVLAEMANDAGYYYFVMALAERGDLRNAVLKDKLPWRAAMDRVLFAAEGLVYAHSRGHIHRDVKPANILVGANDDAFLTDFDLVAAADTTGGTRTGGGMGTFCYAAPELLSKPQDATARADVFGLGMTVVFAIKGEELTGDVWRNTEETIDAFECNEPLKAVLSQAVDWDPQGRFGDANEFVQALRAALNDANASSKPRRKKKTRKRKASATRKSQPRRYPVPEVTKRQVLNAMRHFDEELRQTSRWLRWEASAAHQYAVENDGRRYPVKQILSRASGLPTGAFTGGPEACSRFRDHGFEIVELHPEPGPTKD
jgi:serine/threonine protein kinase